MGARGRAAAVRRPRNEKRKPAKRTGSEAPLSLRVGERVVLPPHGVVEVVAIEQHEFDGVCERFYSLRSFKNGFRVLLPARRSTCPGVRRLVSREVVDDAFRILRQHERSITASTWTKRQKACNERLRSGSLLAMAEVLRDLCLAKQTKSLSTAERRLLETTHDLFVTEVALASQRSEADVNAELRRIFAST